MYHKLKVNVSVKFCFLCSPSFFITRHSITVSDSDYIFVSIKRTDLMPTSLDIHLTVSTAISSVLATLSSTNTVSS